MSSKCIYYVYAYLREKDSKTAKAGSPYYIGKGKGKRAYGKHYSCPVPKNKSLIIFLETNLSEIGALALERRMIEWYGRIDSRSGILRNQTDGGDGTSGVIRTEETRRKLREIRKLQVITEETKHKLSALRKGRTHSEETKKKISAANAGKIRTTEHRQNQSIARTGQKLKPHTEETKRKIAAANTGRTKSESSKQKMSDSAKARKREPRSEETRRKIAEAMKRRHSLGNQII